MFKGEVSKHGERPQQTATALCLYHCEKQDKAGDKREES
ncbi:hypothetical protein D027_0527 [Vibrio parahaemolyticus 861]|nr:hypothetical protein D027_0527 [Vibrio parahaemolyticus 861]EWM39523.1 hypothetical protein D043_0583 [Vibrio parahaemolyticus EKP-021]